MSNSTKEFIANLKPSYDSGFGDNLGKEFYSPCLERCKEYRRMTGEFRSSVIFDWGKALLKVLENNDDKCIVKIIANPSLNQFDAEAFLFVDVNKLSNTFPCFFNVFVVFCEVIDVELSLTFPDQAYDHVPVLFVFRKYVCMYVFIYLKSVIVYIY